MINQEEMDHKDLEQVAGAEETQNVEKLLLLKLLLKILVKRKLKNK